MTFSNNDTVLVDSTSSRIYAFVPTAANFTSALSSCVAIGSNSGTNGSLVSYSSYAEAFKVESYFAEKGPLRPYWLGLRVPAGSSWCAQLLTCLIGNRLQEACINLLLPCAHTKHMPCCTSGLLLLLAGAVGDAVLPMCLITTLQLFHAETPCRL